MEAVKCVVILRRNNDGQMRRYENRFAFDGPSMWEDGNFSCDCNRADFFREAAGEDCQEFESCGDERYSVRIISLSGDELYRDGNWSA